MSAPLPRPDPDASEAPASPNSRPDTRSNAPAAADAARAASDEVLGQTMRALGRIVGRFTPWLIEFGSWIFAGLIAFILIILASLITVGPADPAVIIAATAFAMALPVNLSGLFMLRLIQDMQRIGFGDAMTQAFQEAGLPMGEFPEIPPSAPSEPVLATESVRESVTESATPPEQTDREARQRTSQRTNLVLLYALVTLVVSVVLTLTGMVGALWHMAWWIAVVFLVMLLLSLGAVLGALITIRPPDTPAQRQRYQRYWGALMARARQEQEQARARARR